MLIHPEQIHLDELILNSRFCACHGRNEKHVSARNSGPNPQSV